MKSSDQKEAEHKGKQRIMLVDDQNFNIDAAMIILEYKIKLKYCE